ncbi:MAG: hypothetical protein V7K88_09100 [Nostoc sp.]|uniref:hypothetical protein n=1 Tax=Nostoc sp. TaxID=1180 RepID=UPI002FFC012A
MVRLYLFAEGQTEQTFADTLIKPHLAQHEVFMHPPRDRSRQKKGEGASRRWTLLRANEKRYSAIAQGR